MHYSVVRKQRSLVYSAWPFLGKEKKKSQLVRKLPLGLSINWLRQQIKALIECQLMLNTLYMSYYLSSSEIWLTFSWNVSIYR